MLLIKEVYIRQKYLFSWHENSLKQLLFLICLKKLLNIDCEIFDPAFTFKETELLSELGFKVIKKNEMCKREIGDKKTLFFIIGLDLSFIDNIIKSNWNQEKLNNITFIFNSITKVRKYGPSHYSNNQKILKSLHWYSNTDVREDYYLSILSKFGAVKEYKINFHDASLYKFNTSVFKSSDDFNRFFEDKLSNIGYTNEYAPMNLTLSNLVCYFIDQNLPKFIFTLQIILAITIYYKK